MDSEDLLQMTVDIASAFVSGNTVHASEMSELIASIHAALTGLANPRPTHEPVSELKPAVPIKKSITNDYLICLEDGRKLKSMKRYLSGLGMTPDEYRAKWGLPRDYPMVAPGYAAKRSALAKASGLGNGRRKVDAVEASAPGPAYLTDPDAAAFDAPAKRRPGRPKKAA